MSDSLLPHGLYPTRLFHPWDFPGKSTEVGCHFILLCIKLLRLTYLYAEYIMRNACLDEAQVEIKIAGRNINNIRYADDTTLTAESEEELKSLLMRVKEESEKVGLMLNIRKLRS